MMILDASSYYHLFLIYLRNFLCSSKWIFSSISLLICMFFLLNIWMIFPTHVNWFFWLVSFVYLLDLFIYFLFIFIYLVPYFLGYPIFSFTSVRLSKSSRNINPMHSMTRKYFSILFSVFKKLKLMKNLLFFHLPKIVV